MLKYGASKFGNAFSGFTLIELLVVIGILGILAAALLATIDPFEQIKKSQDSNMKNISAEIAGGLTRYYTTHSALPWTGGAGCPTTPNLTLLSGLGACITALINDGELKGGFSAASQSYQNKIYLTNPSGMTGNAADTAICFIPDSKSGKKDPSTKFNQDGSINATCPGTGVCYWCTQ
jgi:prepilin-type N-terminal cleavage/methylation domain-containing protein